MAGKVTEAWELAPTYREGDKEVPIRMKSDPSHTSSFAVTAGTQKDLDELLEEQRIAKQAADFEEVPPTGPVSEVNQPLPSPSEGLAEQELQPDISPADDAVVAAPVDTRQAAVAAPAAPTTVDQTQTSETITTEGKSLDQEFQDNLKSAQLDQSAAIRFSAASDAEQQKMLHDELKLQSIAQDKRVQTEINREEQRQIDLNDRMDALNARADEVAKLQVDPNQFYGEGITGRRVGALLSIALGGIGAAMQGPGTKNMAMGLIDKAIDRDINVQRANIASQQRGLAEQRGVFSSFLDLTKDERMATAATKRSYLEAARSKIEAMVQGAKAPATLAKAQEAIAGINAGIAKQEAILNTMNVKQQSVEQTKEVPLKPKEPVKVELKAVDQLTQKQGAVDRTKKLLDIYEDPDKFNKLQVGPITGRMTKWLMKQGFPVNEETARVATQQNMALALFVKSMSGAQVTDKERQWFQEMMATPIDDPELARAKLRELHSSLEQDFTDTFNNLDDANQLNDKLRTRFKKKSKVSSFQEQ